MIAGWLLALAIAAMTLGPVRDRPQFGFPQVERFAAFFVLASVFAVAYPRRLRLVSAGLVIWAVVLEIGQAFVPHRDPGLPALAGVVAVQLLRRRAAVHAP